MTPQDLASPSIIPEDGEKQQAREEIRRRKTKIEELKTAIHALESQQQQADRDEHERIHAILCELHTQIVDLEKKTAEHWRAHQSRTIQSHRVTETTIAEIQNRILILEQENLYAISLSAPIRRLPAEILSEIFSFAVIHLGHSNPGPFRPH